MQHVGSVTCLYVSSTYIVAVQHCKKLWVCDKLYSR